MFFSKISKATLSKILITYGIIITIFSFFFRHPFEQGQQIFSPIHMNDAYSAKISQEGYIYVLGSTAVQKFDMNGNFCGGGYFGRNELKKTENHAMLSLNDGNIVCSNYHNIVVFTSDFRQSSIKIAPKNYNENQFYSQYPCNNSDRNKALRMGLFNFVYIDGVPIKLNAFRNMLISMPAGIFVFLVGIIMLKYNEH